MHSNVIYAHLVVPLGTLVAFFRWLRVENSVVCYLGILDHVKGVMFGTSVRVGLPLFIRFKDMSICACAGER